MGLGFSKQSGLSQNLLFLLEKSNKGMKKYKKQIRRFPDDLQSREKDLSR